MRTSRDVYKNALGALIQLSQNEQSREFIAAHGLTLWSGYDYDRQEWVHEGKKDTRTLEELRASIAVNN